ncbi:hypothetical protein K488DRAFT_92877, partial [Vararia minispora EC-137]
PTVLDWFGRVLSAWVLDYTPSTGIPSFEEVAQTAHDAICERHDLPEKGDVITKSCVIYKRGKQRVYDHRRALLKSAEHLIRNELLNKFVNPKLAQTSVASSSSRSKGSTKSASADARVVADLLSQARNDIVIYIRDKLDTQSWFYQQPKTATKRATGAASSEFILRTFAVHLQSTQNSVLKFEDKMGPPASALALTVVACHKAVQAWESGQWVAQDFSGNNELCKGETDTTRTNSIARNFCGTRVERFKELIEKAMVHVEVSSPAPLRIQASSDRTSFMFAYDGSSDIEPDDDERVEPE